MNGTRYGVLLIAEFHFLRSGLPVGTQLIATHNMVQANNPYEPRLSAAALLLF